MKTAILKEDTQPDGFADKLSADAERKAKESLAHLTFEELSKPQKELLLKKVAIRLGLIKDSEG